MQRKALWIALGGALAILLALVLNPVYPIIKKMWTVPYVFLACGVLILQWALLLFLYRKRIFLRI